MKKLIIAAALLASTAAHADSTRNDTVLGLVSLPFAVGYCNSGPILNVDEAAARALFEKGLKRIHPSRKETDRAYADLVKWSKERGVDEICKIMKEEMLKISDYAVLVK